jgi:TPR repeat protein
LLENGKGVPRNQMKAIESYQKAIELNHPIAMLNLGVCYQEGNGVKKNQNKAIELYQQGVYSIIQEQ